MGTGRLIRRTGACLSIVLCAGLCAVPAFGTEKTDAGKTSAQIQVDVVRAGEEQEDGHEMQENESSAARFSIKNEDSGIACILLGVNADGKESSYRMILDEELVTEELFPEIKGSADDASGQITQLELIRNDDEKIIGISGNIELENADELNVILDFVDADGNYYSYQKELKSGTGLAELPEPEALTGLQEQQEQTTEEDLQACEQGKEDRTEDRQMKQEDDPEEEPVSPEQQEVNAADDSKPKEQPSENGAELPQLQEQPDESVTEEPKLQEQQEENAAQDPASQEQPEADEAEKSDSSEQQEGNEAEKPEPQAQQEGNEAEEPEPQAQQEGNEAEEPEPQAQQEGNEAEEPEPQAQQEENEKEEPEPQQRPDENVSKEPGLPEQQEGSAAEAPQSPEQQEENLTEAPQLPEQQEESGTDQPDLTEPQAESGAEDGMPPEQPAQSSEEELSLQPEETGGEEAQPQEQQAENRAEDPVPEDQTDESGAEADAQETFTQPDIPLKEAPAHRLGTGYNLSGPDPGTAKEISMHTHSKESSDEKIKNETGKEAYEDKKEKSKFQSSPDHNAGSRYRLDELEGINGEYVNAPEDLVIYEYNKEKLTPDSVNVSVSKDSQVTQLKEGTDYSVMLVGDSKDQKIYKYIISCDVFSDDAEYSVVLNSKDESGNENSNETGDSVISFSVDTTAPLIISCPKESQPDAETGQVRIKDNTSVDDVEIYVGEQKVEYKCSGEIYSFRIPAQTQNTNVRVVAMDRAGNTYERVLENYITVKSSKLKTKKGSAAPVFLIISAALLPSGLMIIRNRIRKDHKTCSRRER